MTKPKLHAVSTDARVYEIDNNYEAIREAIGDTISMVVPNDTLGLFVNDNGMLIAQPLNVIVSLMTGMALYGNVVMIAPDPDVNGDSLPANDVAVHVAVATGRMWRAVLRDAFSKGQECRILPNADTIPPAQIIPLTDEEFDKWMRGER